MQAYNALDSAAGQWMSGRLCEAALKDLNPDESTGEALKHTNTHARVTYVLNHIKMSGRLCEAALKDLNHAHPDGGTGETLLQTFSLKTHNTKHTRVHMHSEAQTAVEHNGHDHTNTHTRTQVNLP